MGEIEFEGALSAENARLRKEVEMLKERIVDLQSQLAWTEMELSRKV